MKRLCAAKQSRLSNPPTENACSKRSPRSPPLFCGPRSQHQEDKRTTRTDRGGKERNAENTLARARYPPPRRAKNCRRRKRTEWVSARFFSERTKKRMAHVVWGKRVGTRKTQQQESPCWCARDRQKGKKKVGGCRVPAKKKKKEAAEEEQGCPNTCSVVRAARVPHHPTERPPPTEHSWCIPRGRTTEERKVPEASSGTSRQHTVRR